MRIIYCILLLTACLMCGCKRSSSVQTTETSAPKPRPVDSAAMQRLNGIWIDEETDAVVFMVRTDSVFYPDTLNLPATFCIVEDTLFLSSNPETGYPIHQLSDDFFEYESLSGEVFKLHKSYEPEDSLLFLHRSWDPILLGQLVKRDTVVFSPDGDRYHLYITVNPTHMRVSKTTYTDEGIAVENSYYDNIIHIGVYEGRRRLFSRDFQKRHFADLIPSQFLEGAILSNMSFGKVTNKGCHFLATICEPEGARCYVVNILAGYDGQYHMELTEY